MDAEQIARDVAGRVQEIVAEAEQRAAAIVREAEAEAKRIRARAEAEGNERLAEVRRALSELEGAIGGSGPGASDRPEVDPGPVIVPEPTPDPVPEPGPAPVPEPTPDPVPEPAPEPVPEPVPPPDEGTPPAPDLPEGAERAAATNGAPRSRDATAARLVAMNMALEGSSREQIAAALAAEYDLDDRDELVADVLARAGR